MSIRSKLETDRATRVPFGKTSTIEATDVERAILAVEAAAAADLAAHLADAVAAHAASAISVTPAGTLAATEVQAALVEILGDVETHVADATAAHAASAISYSGGTGMSATDVEAAIDELANEKLNSADYTAADVLSKLLTVDGSGSGLDADLLDGQSSAFYATATSVSDHLADTTDAHDASAISVTPSGSLAADDVQEALLEILGDVEAHVADSSAAHAASAISYNGGTGMSATDVEGAIDELATEKQDAATAITQGKHTIWVPAGAMVSATTSGAASDQSETPTNDINFKFLRFDDAADEYAHFQVAFPKGWNEGTVTYQVFWTSEATDTDGVAWGLQAVAVTDGDTNDPSWGTAVVVTDDNQGAAFDVLVTSESAAVTIADTPADGDLVFFRIFRDVSDANDDMIEDARLIGVKLFYTINASTDA